MGLHILENGLMDNNMEKVRKFGQKDPYLKGSLETARNTVKENMYGFKDADTMEIGMKTKSQDMVVTNGKTAEYYLII